MPPLFKPYIGIYVHTMPTKNSFTFFLPSLYVCVPVPHIYIVLVKNSKPQLIDYLFILNLFLWNLLKIFAIHSIFSYLRICSTMVWFSKDFANSFTWFSFKCWSRAFSFFQFETITNLKNISSITPKLTSFVKTNTSQSHLSVPASAVFPISL